MMSDLIEELTVLLAIIWWMGKLEILSVSKWTAQKFNMKKFSFKNLNDVTAKQEC
jgi:hypothetical protein